MKSAVTYLAILIAVGVAIWAFNSMSVDEAPPEATSGSVPRNGSEPPETAEAMPDIVITSISVSPTGPVPPGNVEILATVRNQGLAAYGNAIVVEEPGGSSGVIPDGLAVGESQTVVIDILAVSPGATYTLRLTVDPDDVIAEQDESNNESEEISFMTTP